MFTVRSQKLGSCMAHATCTPREGQRVITYDDTSGWSAKRVTQFDGEANGKPWDELLQSGTHEVVTYTEKPWFGREREISELRRKSSPISDCNESCCCIAALVCSCFLFIMSKTKG